MIHLLDSNACITHLRSQGHSRLSAKLLSVKPGDIAVCSIVVEKLLFCVWRSANVRQNMTSVRAMLVAFPSLPFNDNAAEAASKARAALEGMGQRIGYNDLLIAGIAMANNLVLVTHNVGELSRVPGLQLVDWEREA